MCAEGGVLSKKFTAAAACVIFAKARSPGADDLAFEQFVSALALVAEVWRRSKLDPGLKPPPGFKV